jgi:hypothetical protein
MASRSSLFERLVGEVVGPQQLGRGPLLVFIDALQAVTHHGQPAEDAVVVVVVQHDGGVQVTVRYVLDARMHRVDRAAHHPLQLGHEGVEAVRHLGKFAGLVFGQAQAQVGITTGNVHQRVADLAQWREHRDRQRQVQRHDRDQVDRNALRQQPVELAFQPRLDTGAGGVDLDFAQVLDDARVPFLQFYAAHKIPLRGRLARRGHRRDHSFALLQTEVLVLSVVHAYG